MTARITYNSVNIDVTLAKGGEEPDFIQEKNENRSASGKIETINLHGIQEILFDAYFSLAAYYDLVAWWAWARQGKSFSFAVDSTKAADTILDGAANSGQAVIPLTSTSGLSVDDVCFIKAADNDDEFEVVVIDSISAGVSITAKENLVYSYTSGDEFRHFLYWPSVKTTNKKFKPQRTGAIDTTGRFFRHTFRFVEAL